MPRTTRHALLVPLAAGLLLTGCSATIEGTAAPTGGSPASSGGTGVEPTDDPVVWLDQVCGTLATLTATPADAPQIDPAADPAEFFEQLEAQLGRTSDQLDGSIQDLQAVGPSPIEGGDEFARRMSDLLDRIRTTLDEFQEQVANADPNDPASLLDGLGTLSDPQAVRDLQGLQDTLRDDPDIAPVAGQAAQCRQVVDLEIPGG